MAAHTDMPEITDIAIKTIIEFGIFPVFGSSCLISCTEEQESPTHAIKLPFKALVLSAIPILLFSTSKIPRKDVKKAPPS